MPGAGTDKTKNWVVAAGTGGDPGRAAARREHRLGGARDGQFRPLADAAGQAAGGWPNPQAHDGGSGADRVLEEAVLYDTSEAAVADCTLVLATTARAHDQAKPVVDAGGGGAADGAAVAAGENVAILFGRERTGLKDDEVGAGRPDRHLPVNPAFASLNLPQAVLVIAYEWFKLATAGALPFAMPQKSPPATKQQLLAFFANLERELDKVEFFRPPEKRATMQINLHNIFTAWSRRSRISRRCTASSWRSPTAARGRRAAACSTATRRCCLRSLLAEHEQGQGCRRARRGARPVAAAAPQSDRRRTHALGRADEGSPFRPATASSARRRSGRMSTDMVSFRCGSVVELVPADESEAAAGRARSARPGSPSAAIA